MTGVKNFNIIVVGLGYVGLPLAVALARQFRVTGLDVDTKRVEELRRHHDRTGEVEPLVLEHSPLRLTSSAEDCRGADIYIITVPTPVDEQNRPDLRAVEGASRSVGALLDGSKRPIVVYESTVYPGVTEEICAPILEQASGLVCGDGFFLGYSPERINPGDREHTVDRIVKVVAGQNEAVTETLAQVYGAVTTAGVFRAASIKAAEAAKVIENAQRDINIAFMNEITQIFAKLDISIWDVLDAAGTKWNFLNFQPGLVGGHCIGVDPYYLSHRAQQLGHDPDVILAGRSINDRMGSWVADCLHRRRGERPGSVLVMGLTFKEDVPDLRNSKVIDLIRRLEALGHQVTVHDPRADAGEARHEYGLQLDAGALNRSYDLVVAAVPHAEYRILVAEDIRRLANDGGCIADLKGVWRRLELGPGVDRWTL
ncbi:MAG: nucleotide sugar dehydrogenase [Pseudomonadota bacterium]|nr:nucleotide sugar dehydrogenase [Pseudomonadota bacterium]